MKKSARDLRPSAAIISVANIRAIAFDGYGTLFDFTEPDFIAAFAEICALQGLDADAADLWRRFLRAALYFRSEKAGAIKPDPAIFHYLTARLGLSPAEVLSVGDNPVPDVLGPRQAGLRVAWGNRAGVRRP